ncbi:hypothetical protein pipiens_017128, partial [Culex pipiens pipiens]
MCQQYHVCCVHDFVVVILFRISGLRGQPKHDGNWWQHVGSNGSSRFASGSRQEHGAGGSKLKPSKFTVDAGRATLEVKFNDVFANTLQHNMTKNENGHSTTSTDDPVTDEVNYGRVAIPGYPFCVNVSTPLDPFKVHCFVPRQESGSGSEICGAGSVS